MKTAILKDTKLQIVREVSLFSEGFPDIIEADEKRYVRIGITDKIAVYREATTYKAP